LRDPIQLDRRRDSDRFVQRRHHVDHVMELLAQTAAVLYIRAGHETIIGLRVPPKWLATCLVHWNGVSMAHAHSAVK